MISVFFCEVLCETLFVDVFCVFSLYFKFFKLAIEFSGYSIVEHKWHYYQYALLEKSKSKKQIDFGIEGDNPLEVLKVLKRPRFYLAATFIKRSARNLIIRLLGPSLGAKSLRKGAHLRNFFRGW